MILRQVFVAALTVIGLTAPAISANPKNLRTELMAAVTAAQNHDCKSALAIVAEQIKSADFAALPAQLRVVVYRLGAGCAAQSGQWDLAAHYGEAGTMIPGAPAEFWTERFGVMWEAKRWADGVAVLETMAQTSPDALNAVPIAWLSQAYRDLKTMPELQRRLLHILSSQTYVPAQVGMSADFFSEQQALILAESGDKVAAAAMVARIESPNNLMRLSLDPRVRDLFTVDFDARAAVEKHMARMREIAAAHIGAIRPQLNVADDLLMLGKGEEALATLQSLHPETADSSFSDKDVQLNWWWNSKARASTMLGRYDDAVAAYTAGQALAENGQPNFSQRLNLADLHLRFGHPAQALATLEPIGAGKVNGSPYGMMQFHGAHGCASTKVGKTDDVQANLAYMRAHDGDAPGALAALLLCMGDYDGAARSIIAQLNAPDNRAATLLDLSDYAPWPATYVPSSNDLGLQVLKSRPDVKAAIARAGGAGRFNIPPL